MLDLSLVSNTIETPAASLTICGVNADDVWPRFESFFARKSPKHEQAIYFGMFAKDEMIGFNSVVPPPYPATRTFIGMSLSILPAWRGKGLGILFDEWAGELLHANGYRYITDVENANLIRAFDASPRWKIAMDQPRAYIYVPTAVP